MINFRVLPTTLLFGLAAHAIVLAAEPFEFTEFQLPVELQVGYAVRVVDVNQDGQQDIAIVDSKRVLWLEGPSWTEHVIYATPDAKFDNVCFAPHDINGDGKLDFALGADWQFGNTDSGGTIGWLEQTESGPWNYHRLSSEPTTHRMNWVQMDGAAALIVAPLKGRGTRKPGFDQQGVRLLKFTPADDPVSGSWQTSVITDRLHVMHNFEVTDLDADGTKDLITASYEGVTWIRFDGVEEARLQRIAAGQQQAAPAKGASEIRHGRLADRSYLATIEPWHGDKVVVYTSPSDWRASKRLWARTVLDTQLAWGHAVACANLDDDPEQELIVGVRDDAESSAHRAGVRIYDPVRPLIGKWDRHLVDPGGVRVEDLVCADLDGDGDNDIVAVGRQSHNAKIYWNQFRP